MGQTQHMTSSPGTVVPPSGSDNNIHLFTLLPSRGRGISQGMDSQLTYPSLISHLQRRTDTIKHPQSVLLPAKTNSCSVVKKISYHQGITVSNRHTNKQTHKQISKQTNKQINKPTKKQVRNQTNKQLTQFHYVGKNTRESYRTRSHNTG